MQVNWALDTAAYGPLRPVRLVLGAIGGCPRTPLGRWYGRLSRRRARRAARRAWRACRRAGLPHQACPRPLPIVLRCLAVDRLVAAVQS